ncbi:hypothetical protein Taro_032401, partial [Colocasia esculenta]|nr:hypothetical protein [Colocasia esculenta]
ARLRASPSARSRCISSGETLSTFPPPLPSSSSGIHVSLSLVLSFSGCSNGTRREGESEAVAHSSSIGGCGGPPPMRSPAMGRGSSNYSDEGGRRCRGCQRILILSLLSLSVLVPIAFLSSRLGSVSPSSSAVSLFAFISPKSAFGSSYPYRKEFEDIPGLEGGEGLKEPVREILNDKDFIEPLIDQKTSADNVSTRGIWNGGENDIYATKNKTVIVDAISSIDISVPSRKYDIPAYLKEWVMKDLDQKWRSWKYADINEEEVIQTHFLA